jgi:hypothetical protein
VSAMRRDGFNSIQKGNKMNTLNNVTNEEALEQVEKATESEPAKSKDLLESEDLERKVVDSKKRITDENTSRPTS